MSIDLDVYKNKLLSERDRILNKISAIEDKANSYEGLNNNFKESTGELSSYDNHPADNASIIFERGKDIGIKDNARLFLRMIDDALNKINNNEYGVCDKCGIEINESRLDIMPYTTMCLECKENLEDSSADRPLEEEAVLDMHEAMFLDTDTSDNISFDGEDSWQQLAKVGSSNTPAETLGDNNSFESYIDEGGFSEKFND